MVYNRLLHVYMTVYNEDKYWIVAFEVRTVHHMHWMRQEKIVSGQVIERLHHNADVPTTLILESPTF